MQKAASLIDLNKLKENGKNYVTRRETRRYTIEGYGGNKERKLINKKTKSHIIEVNEYGIEKELEKQKKDEEGEEETDEDDNENEDESENDYQEEEESEEEENEENPPQKAILFEENCFDNYLQSTISCMKQFDKHLLMTDCFDEHMFWQSFEKLIEDANESCDYLYVNMKKDGKEGKFKGDKQKEKFKENKKEHVAIERGEESEYTNIDGKDTTFNSKYNKQNFIQKKKIERKAISIHFKKKPKQELSLFDLPDYQTDDERIEKIDQSDKSKQIEPIDQNNDGRETQDHNALHMNTTCITKLHGKNAKIQSEKDKCEIMTEEEGSSIVYNIEIMKHKKEKSETYIEDKENERTKSQGVAVKSYHNMEIKEMNNCLFINNPISLSNKMKKYDAIIGVEESAIVLNLKTIPSKYNMDIFCFSRLNGNIHIRNFNEQFLCIIASASYFDLQVKWETSRHFFDGASVELVKTHLINKSPHTQNIHVYFRNKKNEENKLIEILGNNFQKINSSMVASNVINSFEGVNEISHFLTKHQTYVKEIDAMVGVELDERTYMYTIHILKILI